MAIGARLVGRAGPRASIADAEAFFYLARLLLVAVALDLIVTRFVVRLAIFVPKAEPLAQLSATLGRIGAATDAFVPLAGLLLLGALLFRVGRTGRRGEAVLLVALAVIAVGGFALILVPPLPVVMLALESLVIAIAAGSAIRAREARGPAVARVGFVALAVAIAAAAAGRSVDLVGVIAGWSADGPGGALARAMVAIGQVAFVCGAALVGVGGLAGVGRRDPARGRFAALGLAAALVVLVAAALAPATWGALAIWSIGLAGGVPAPVVAVALGLAVAGLPVLHGRAPVLAIGASLVLLSGYDLAASGLVMAGLLGLVVASSTDGSDPDLVRDWSPAP